MMFVVSYRLNAEHSIVVEAADEAAARAEFLGNDRNWTCDDCGGEPLEPVEVVDVTATS